ncbi:hypothetical protein [Streptomyces buecherae]|uniref:Uncharacterized protein n=1 Tax=Streptomyces buecherae TaxID=2763006 RepID=A0A7H8N199_9ACTN|nr:hypothetical protein [Streptomyces buecherae]QKW48264.1 hypothetical protein HUT08_00450 [Streptomyces buecherae]
MSPTDENTVQFVLKQVTKGLGHIVDDDYLNALDSASEGGEPLEEWFDSTNQTADFWNWMYYNQDDAWAPGVDPDGNPIQMASNGNLDMRNGVFSRDLPDELDGLTDADINRDDPPIAGIATIQTRNTTSQVSQTLTLSLGIAGLPPSLTLTKALFADLIKPAYKNCRTYFNKSTKEFKEASEVESPDIDPQELAEGPAADASAEAEELGGEIAEQGAEYLAIEWGSVVGEVAGIGVITALPLIFEFIGEKLLNTVSIHNLTDIDFTWDLLLQKHGETTVMPKDQVYRKLPKMDYNTDSWGDHTTVKVAYDAEFQFINSSDLGSIGYVLSLTPSDGSPEAKAVVSIPWAGKNTIWVGQSGDDADTIYKDHSTPDDRLSVTADFGTYTVTWAITALEGTQGGQYFYGVHGTIRPKS